MKHFILFPISGLAAMVNQEKVNIIAFLKILTNLTGVNDPRYSHPFRYGLSYFIP